MAWPLCHWLEEYGAVAGGGGDFRGVLKDDGPGGGFFAVPEVVFFRLLSGEVEGFVPEVADGAVFGWAEVGARVGLFVVSHCGGEEGGKIVWIFDKDGLQGEAAILIKLTNVLGGEAGGCFGWALNKGDAEAMAVGHEGNFERGERAEVSDGGITPVDDEGSGFGDPVIGELAGGFDERLKFGRELGE